MEPPMTATLGNRGVGIARSDDALTISASAAKARTFGRQLANAGARLRELAQMFTLFFVQSLRAALSWELPPALNLNRLMSSQMLPNF